MTYIADTVGVNNANKREHFKPTYITLTHILRMYVII